MYYLGIDGGGTNTTAVVTDRNGKIITKKSGGTINFYSVGYENARKNLSVLMNEIRAETEIESFSGAFIGCSALDSEADGETTKKLCDGIINADKIRMHSDVYIALKSVKGAECPCVAICGTGSIAAGEDENGNIYVTGGWGHLLGDEGSAYSIALNAFRQCCLLSDSGTESPLVDAANEFFGVDDFRKAIDIIYSPDMTKDKIARFAPIVCKLAEEGNDDAVVVVKNEAESFCASIVNLLQNIKNCDVLGLYGGVFQNNHIFTQVFKEFLTDEFGDVTVKIIDTPPEETAAELARGL